MGAMARTRKKSKVTKVKVRRVRKTRLRRHIRGLNMKERAVESWPPFGTHTTVPNVYSRLSEERKVIPLPDMEWGYCDLIPKNHIHKIATAQEPEGVIVKAGARHNHVLCKCPACGDDAVLYNGWYKCVLTNQYIRYNNIHRVE